MKKFILAMVTLFTMTVSTASAMSYEQARQQALFLTDKMAYELNLTDDQYEAAYEVNLDYLMGVNTLRRPVRSILETAQRRLELHSPRLAIPQHSSMPHTSIAHSTGTVATGISASTPDTLTATTSSSVALTSTPYTEADTAGTENGGRSWYSGRTYGRPHPDGGPRMGMRDGFNHEKLQDEDRVRQHDTPKQHTHHRDTRSPDGKQPLIR